jgi:D-galactonate transporter
MKSYPLNVRPDEPSPLFIEQTYTKVSWRLIPFLFLLYIVAYLDRVNVGFAQLQMKSDLGFSDAVYGFGAGIFFVGYVLFEVPSNLFMERVGARFWIARIMITWGIVSSSMMVVHSDLWFYALRFLLGIGEAGFAPGIILYITYWYPAERRAGVFSMYMIALAISGVIGGPLSGWILTTLSGVHGLAGWQWLFLLEGLPAIVLGVIVLFYLDDAPRKAVWLTDDEKTMLEDALEQERQTKLALGHTHSLAQSLTNKSVLLLGVAYFLILCGLYGISFWLPQIVRGLGVKDAVTIGFLTAAMYSAAAVTMLLVSRRSDRVGERRWHIFVCATVGALGFAASAFTSSTPGVSFIALTAATCGVLAILPVFWTLPTAFLSGTAAAAGVALINSFGNVGGFAAPYAIGLIKQATGSTDTAMLVLGAVVFAGGALVLVFRTGSTHK